MTVFTTMPFLCFLSVLRSRAEGVVSIQLLDWYFIHSPCHFVSVVVCGNRGKMLPSSAYSLLLNLSFL